MQWLEERCDWLGAGVQIGERLALSEGSRAAAAERVGGPAARPAGWGPPGTSPRGARGTPGAARSPPWSSCWNRSWATTSRVPTASRLPGTGPLGAPSASSARAGAGGSAEGVQGEEEGEGVEGEAEEGRGWERVSAQGGAQGAHGEEAASTDVDRSPSRGTGVSQEGANASGAPMAPTHCEEGEELQGVVGDPAPMEVGEEGRGADGTGGAARGTHRRGRQRRCGGGGGEEAVGWGLEDEAHLAGNVAGGEGEKRRGRLRAGRGGNGWGE